MPIKFHDYQVPIQLRIDRNKGKISGSFRVLTFIDHGSRILYVPELNLSAYGDNKDEAFEMFEEVFEEFTKGLLSLSKKEMDMELAKYGFFPQKLAHKDFKFSGAFVDSSGVLKEFNLPEDTIVETQLATI